MGEVLEEEMGIRGKGRHWQMVERSELQRQGGNWLPADWKRDIVTELTTLIGPSRRLLRRRLRGRRTTR